MSDQDSGQNITQLVTQLQQAHRLAAGFYHWLLPRFDEIAKEALNAEFWFWNPTETLRSSNRKDRPSRSWVWDYLPLFASTHAYRDRDGNTALKDGKAVIFRLYIDNDFRKDSDLRKSTNRQPDPLEMSEKSVSADKAVVEVNLYHCQQESDWALLKDAGRPARQLNSQEKAQCKALEICSTHRLLADFLADPDSVTNWIKEKSAIAKPVTGPEQAS